MSETPETPPSAIIDDTAFQDRITHALSKEAPVIPIEKFALLEQEIHASLARQESELTLSIITK